MLQSMKALFRIWPACSCDNSNASPWSACVLLPSCFSSCSVYTPHNVLVLVQGMGQLCFEEGVLHKHILCSCPMLIATISQPDVSLQHSSIEAVANNVKGWSTALNLESSAFDQDTLTRSMGVCNMSGEGREGSKGNKST